MALSTGIRAESAKDSLHKVVVVVRLTLVNHVVALSLDPRVLAQPDYCFGHQRVAPPSNDLLDAALLVHFEEPKAEERLLGGPVTIENHFM